MPDYFKDANKLSKKIEHYCTYGAENRDLRAKKLLNDLGDIMDKARKAGDSDLPLIHAKYREMRKLVEDLGTFDPGPICSCLRSGGCK